MLPWFLKNYCKHNLTPIVLADFGMSMDMRTWAHQRSEFVDVLYLDYRKTKRAWFLKPRAMLEIQSKYTCWLDTDIHILGDISRVFDYAEEDKLGMVEDKPWTKRSGELWHNSGVVVFKDKPKVLYDWERACRTNPIRGDQETLHYMLDTPLKKNAAVNSIPNIYNWLRVQIFDGEDNPNKLAMHWTGFKGKEQIRKLMYHEKK
jgi:hypothetical protein